MKRYTLVALLLTTPPAHAGECSHNQQDNGCSEEGRHSRAKSDWRGRYEEHSRSESGRHERERSNWQGSREPTHSRAASQRDR